MAAETQSARSPSRSRPTANTGALPKPDPGLLTPDQEKTARKMLIDGATFEDVVLTIQARGQKVAQHAVENYFRSNPELFALRAEHSIEVARGIRTKTKDGSPDDVQLADAVIMTGLQRLNRATAMLDVNDALRRNLERENADLKQQKLRLEVRHELTAEQFYRARIRMLTVQYKAARGKLKKLQEELRHAKKGTILGPEIAARIQEIYGLVQAPPVPPVGAPQTEEREAR